MIILNVPSGERINYESDIRCYGVLDKKGRRIGGQAFLWEEDLVPKEFPDSYHTSKKWTLPAGHYFVFTPHATRNGKLYGALQDHKYFKTAEERARAVSKYFEAAKKRYQKEFGQ